MQSDITINNAKQTNEFNRYDLEVITGTLLQVLHKVVDGNEKAAYDVLMAALVIHTVYDMPGCDVDLKHVVDELEDRLNDELDENGYYDDWDDEDDDCDDEEDRPEDDDDIESNAAVIPINIVISSSEPDTLDIKVVTP
ncbi:MAG: hypothetical protein RBR71_11415 [Gudongella sp.]|nr:hypothetical protein [Gudongella sp.]